MKLLIDFFPIIVLFAVYKFYGIFAATAAAIVASALQILFFKIKYRRFEPTQMVAFILIIVFGGATLVLHQAIFIKWKVTILYWLFAIMFLISQFIGKKPFIKYLFQDKIILPETIWTKLNFSWIGFFLIMGTVNLYVIYHYSTNTWINFKLFGIIGATIVFGILQSLLLSKHLQESEVKE